MDANELPTIAPIMFATPLEGVELKALHDYATDMRSPDQTHFVSGKIVGIVPSAVWRYDHNRGATMPSTKWWALVCKSTDTQVAEVTQQLADAKRLADGWCQKAKELEKGAKEGLAEKVRLLKQVNAQAETIVAYERSIKDRNQSLMTLETHLAAVKKHIGEKAFAEALAAIGK